MTTYYASIKVDGRWTPISPGAAGFPTYRAAMEGVASVSAESGTTITGDSVKLMLDLSSIDLTSRDDFLAIIAYDPVLKTMFDFGRFGGGGQTPLEAQTRAVLTEAGKGVVKVTPELEEFILGHAAEDAEPGEQVEVGATPESEGEALERLHERYASDGPPFKATPGSKDDARARRLYERRPGDPCPEGDPTCPCQDGDVCHYQDDPETGTQAWPLPAGSKDEAPDAVDLQAQIDQAGARGERRQALHDFVPLLDLAVDRLLSNAANQRPGRKLHPDTVQALATEAYQQARRMLTKLGVSEAELDEAGVKVNG